MFHFSFDDDKSAHSNCMKLCICILQKNYEKPIDTIVIYHEDK